MKGTHNALEKRPWLKSFYETFKGTPYNNRCEDKGYKNRWTIVWYSVHMLDWFELILHRKVKMDETTFQIFDRVVSTLFNDGVVNFGRILTPFVFTRGLCRKYHNDAQRLWCVYQRCSNCSKRGMCNIFMKTVTFEQTLNQLSILKTVIK